MQGGVLQIVVAQERTRVGLQVLDIDAEKHHFAGGEPLPAHSKNLGNAGRLKHYRARLAAVELDD